MTLAEARVMVAAAVAGVKVATVTDPFLRSLPRGVAQGAEDRTCAIFKHALGLAEGLAQRGATDIDFNGILARLLVQHAGMAAAVIYDHGETIGALCHRVERAEAKVEALSNTIEQTLAELVLVRRDLLEKELDG